MEKHNRIKYFLLFLWVLFALIPLVLYGSLEEEEVYIVEPQLTPLGSFVQSVAGWILFTVYLGSQVIIGFLISKDE